ncbi:hypothetical protein QC762_0077360 [Podospora pseudocomata]|uniref:Uncharacterized protein n=1 Tax=Podospora pseudocomata TaxID=2093779 RepID=A0ABR0GAU2_9PEZI|nr:hypothetical protein QC762_0077360 [Podospora pseudocomata]
MQQAPPKTPPIIRFHKITIFQLLDPTFYRIVQVHKLDEGIPFARDNSESEGEVIAYKCREVV